MCIFVPFENVTANALVVLYEKYNKTEVTFDTLVKYGQNIIRQLRKRTKDEYILLFSRKYQLSMIEKYPEFFDAKFSNDGNSIFYLKSKKLNELKEHFLWTMSVPMIEVFYSDEAVSKLKF